MSGVSRNTHDQDRTGGQYQARGRPSNFRGAGRAEQRDGRDSGWRQQPRTNYSRNDRVNQVAQGSRTGFPPSNKSEHTPARRPPHQRALAKSRSSKQHRSTAPYLNELELEKIYDEKGMEGLKNIIQNNPDLGTVERLGDLTFKRHPSGLQELSAIALDMMESQIHSEILLGFALLNYTTRKMLEADDNLQIIATDESLKRKLFKIHKSTICTKSYYRGYIIQVMSAYCNSGRFDLAYARHREAVLDFPDQAKIYYSIFPAILLLLAADHSKHKCEILILLDSIKLYTPSKKNIITPLPILRSYKLFNFDCDTSRFVSTISGILKKESKLKTLSITRMIVAILNCENEHLAITEIYKEIDIPDKINTFYKETPTLFSMIFQTYCHTGNIKEALQLRNDLGTPNKYSKMRITWSSLDLLHATYNNEAWRKECHSIISELQQGDPADLKAAFSKWMSHIHHHRKIEALEFSDFFHRTFNLAAQPGVTIVSPPLPESLLRAQTSPYEPVLAAVNVVVTQKNNPDFGLIDLKYLGLTRPCLPSVQSHSDALEALAGKKALTFRTLSEDLQDGLDVSEHELATAVVKGTYFSMEPELPTASEASMVSFIRLGRGQCATLPAMDSTPTGRTILIAHPYDLREVDPRTLVGERRDLFLISTLNGYPEGEARFAYPRRLAALSIAQELGYTDMMLLDDNIESFFVSTPLHPKNASWDDLYSLYRKAGQETGVSIVSSKTISTGWSEKQCFSDQLEVEKNSLGAKVDWINLNGLDLSELVKLNPPKMSLWGENYWFARCLMLMNKDKESPVFASITRQSLVIKRASKLLNAAKAAMTGGAPALAWFAPSMELNSKELRTLVRQMQEHVEYSQDIHQSRSKTTKSLEWVGAQQLSFKNSLRERNPRPRGLDTALSAGSSRSTSIHTSSQVKAAAAPLQAMSDSETSCLASLLTGINRLIADKTRPASLRSKNLRHIQRAAIGGCQVKLRERLEGTDSSKSPIFNIQLATGTGKTRVFAFLALAYLLAEARQKHVLIVCPNINLTQQARQAFADLELSPVKEAKIIEVHSGSTGSLKASTLSLEMLQEANSGSIIIACANSARLFTEPPEYRQEFGCVLFDEYHLIPDELIERFDTQSPAGPVVIGFSATGEEKSCGDSIIKYNLMQAHDKGLVSGWKVERLDQASPGTSLPQHLHSQLSTITHPDGEKLEKLQGMIVVSRIKEAQDLGLYLKKSGLQTAAINYENGTSANRDYIRLFQERKIQILLTVDMLQEGTNLPNLRWVLIARNINSIRLKQLLGRAVRQDFGKTNAYVGVVSEGDPFSSFDLALEYPTPEGVSLTSRPTRPTPAKKSRKTHSKSQDVVGTKRTRRRGSDSPEEGTLWVPRKREKN